LVKNGLKETVILKTEYMHRVYVQEDERSVMNSTATKTLADLEPGQKGVVQGIDGDLNLKRRLSALGLVNGTQVMLGHTAPLGDPRVYEVLDYTLSLRNEEARKIRLQQED